MTVGRLTMQLGGVLGLALALVLGQFASATAPNLEAGEFSSFEDAAALGRELPSVTVSANSVAEASAALGAGPSATAALAQRRPDHETDPARVQAAPETVDAGTEEQASAVSVDPPAPMIKADWRIARPPTRVVPLKKYRISALFRAPGPHTGGVHSGLDFATPEGRKIVSICAGKVIQAKWLGNAGQSVVVRMEDGTRVLYGHMSRISTRKGAWVGPGDELGRVGTTGNSTGPHLHLQVTQPNGKSTDPLKTLGMGLNDVKRSGRR